MEIVKKLSSNLYYKPHQIPKLKCCSSHLSVVFAQSIEARCSVENKDVVGAAPTDDAPTTSDWSTILLPIKVQLILNVWEFSFKKIFVKDASDIFCLWVNQVYHSCLVAYLRRNLYFRCFDRHSNKLRENLNNQFENKSSQWLPNTPLASISEWLVS